MPVALLDTNVYIDHWERGVHGEELARIRKAFIVRHSAVVLSELRRGARTAGARGAVEALRRAATIVWAPLEEDWWAAGELVCNIGNRRGWDVGKRRDFQNDALIALTARRHGAAVVTSSRDDFELLADEIPFRVWPL
jgi:predicted nucleic acid-binding protein